MVDTVKLVKVFIGSPGGLGEERRVAKRIVEEINQSHAEHWGCQIQLVGWEATLPGYSRAQSLINQDLDKCEYFVGILWDNWGSKPEDVDTRYTSGFEEEYERAKDRLEQGLVKDIALFFKDIDEVQLKNLHPTYKKVIKFREECERRRKPLFKEFRETIDFEPLLRAKISEIGWRESNAPAPPHKRSADPEQPATQEGDKSGAANGNNLLQPAAARFVTDLLHKPSDWDQTDPFEVARLRLIGVGISRQGNDELYLGTHDANLLFLKRNDFDFSERELGTLVRTGIAGFDHQNVPLWHWLAKSPNFADGINRIEFFAAFGRSHEMANAIRILQTLNRETPSIDEFATRANIIKTWLQDDQDSKVVSAASDFLAATGTQQDLEFILALMDHLSIKRRNEVATIAIALATKKNASEGFKRLIELDPDPINADIANELFASPDSISTSVLQHTLSVKSDRLRKIAAKLLNSRRAIDQATAERLLTDNDPDVRLVALEALERLGKAPDEATIKAALITPKPTGGLFALASQGYSDESLYTKLKQQRLSKFSFEQLRAIAQKSGVYDYLEIDTFYSCYTRRNLREIRTNLDDGFKTHFDTKLASFVQQYGENSKLVADTRGLEKFLRDRLMSLTIAALCKHGSGHDLSLVRRTIDQYDIGFSDSIVGFLARQGDWSDKDRITALSKRYSGSVMSLLWQGGDDDRSTAKALYAIAKSRLLDLLDSDLTIGVRRDLLKILTKKDIKGFNHDVIIRALNNEDDQSRKIFALRCVQALSRPQIAKLLKEYLDGDARRFYNSVHWLDLAVSMPRETAQNVAKFQLDNMR